MLRARIKNGILLWLLSSQELCGIQGMLPPWSCSFSVSWTLPKSDSEFGWVRVLSCGLDCVIPQWESGLQKDIHSLLYWGFIASSQPILTTQAVCFPSHSQILEFPFTFSVEPCVPCWIMYSKCDCLHTTLVFLSG